jgi:8-oxo-dGTP pyrophosphatase MutT (NUDIX family)
MSVEKDIEQLINQVNSSEKTRLQEIFQKYLANQANLTRSNPEIHLSASAVVMKNEKEIFFIEHPYQHEILLPAGHVEVGETPLETAQREFHEETGYFASGDQLIDLNLIAIPENPKKQEKAHLHIDFRYRLTLLEKAPDQAELPVYLLKKEDAPEEFQKYYD